MSIWFFIRKDPILYGDPILLNESDPILRDLIQFQICIMTRSYTSVYFISNVKNSVSTYHNFPICPDSAQYLDKW